MSGKFDLNDNTYTAKEKSFAVVEVGDSKSPDVFYPQVKLMRWDNEVNFSARLVHDEKVAVVSLADDKVRWAGAALEAHFYEIGEGKEGDGFEFEVILKEPPKSNVIQMTLQTKGLDFLYQPPLTQAEIEEGCVRPENVVGSYAVYHQTAAGDYSKVGGHNYRAGKVFPIYRPRIEDAKGNWVWGELNIDAEAGILTVTISQEFLDKAVYPVRHAAGLTFGYSSIGGSLGAHINDRATIHGPYSPASNGNATQIAIYARYWSVPIECTLGLYSLSGSTYTLLKDTAGFNINSTTPQWYILDLDSVLSVLSTSAYYLAHNNNNGWIGQYYDSEPGVTSNWNKPSVAYVSGVLAASFSTPITATADRRHSIYVIFELAGGNLLIHPGMNGGLNRNFNGGLNG